MGPLRRKIFGGVFSLSASSILVRIISFLTVIIVTHFLSVRDYGAYILFLSVVGLFGTLSGLGMDELVTADIARAFGEKDFARGKRLFFEFCRTRLFLVISLLAGSLLLKDFFVERYSVAFGEFFTYLVLIVLMQYCKNVIALLFNVHEKFNLIAKLNIIEMLGKFLVILAMVYSLGLNLQLFIIANIISLAFVAIFFAPKAISLYRELPQYHGLAPQLMPKVMAGHGKWQIGSNIVSSLMNSVTYWLIKAFLNTESVAIYSLAQSMLSFLAGLLPLKTIMLPIIARKSGDKFSIAHLMSRTTKYSLLLYFLAIVFGLLLARPVASIFLPKYLAAIPVFSVHVFRLLFNPFSFSQVPLLYARNKQKFLFFSTLLDSVIVLILAPLLMRKFGVVGLAIEGLITLFIMTSWRELYIRKKFGISSIVFKKLFFFDKYDRSLLREIVPELRNKLFKYLP